MGLYKYPRTPHLPFSEGSTSDDKYASKDTIAFLKSGIELVVTEKMDGGNVTLYRDAFHARSLTSKSHPWDAPAKALWASKRFDIPEGWRVSGESVYAQRSVAYDSLPSCLMVFGIWDEKNNLLSWDTTVEWAELLGFSVVPVLYRGDDYSEAIKVWKKTLNADVSEGFVIRNAGTFAYEDFEKNVAKFVRANHVQTSDEWRGRDDFVVNGFNGQMMTH